MMMRRTRTSNGVSKFNIATLASFFVSVLVCWRDARSSGLGRAGCVSSRRGGSLRRRYLCYRASQLLTNCCGQHTNNVFELRWSLNAAVADSPPAGCSPEQQALDSDDARRRLLVANTATLKTRESKTPARTARRDHQSISGGSKQNERRQKKIWERQALRRGLGGVRGEEDRETRGGLPERRAHGPRVAR